ncbi:helix-turn-helix domain-containing protein [Mycobacterium avium]|uniref:helix-turn-helix domain-containing protein n=1 Tax=Mycobacterium avium TaxID=1764 RepID=UPI001CC4485B|nr:helix-turn-helix transcriptional regulator [Mycobacterium avium]MBZ4514585.1 helix-turn-helix transcriptional regulator [Mycobacterium avium subsp. hominissuis]MBZ4524126.1 helix-turn-helix transcriptional regulator [Mycobacterium avium subsp. hominissuis]MBZ4543896.1 helix-turn-helix transcriptional regulator [Mycobacterium avium subsp. hominissuis]MBZ4553024.1 helix-turn-helix transcriptional regulator [Mycobacterium avium subsp. hominissuis]MBZ4562537.1 helix-turn-helix transcriptional r
MTQRWARDLNARIRQAIRDEREKQGLSAAAVAERTNGFMSRDTLANLESGRKRAVDVPELIVLAHALGVSPLALIYPDLVDIEVEARPGVTMTAGDAALAFAGYLDDDDPTKNLYYLHNARADYERYGKSDDERERDLSRSTLGQITRIVRKVGWMVND